MSSDDWKEIAQLIREAAKKNRLGVALQLFQSLEAREGLQHREVRSRGAGNDPPDCEARDATGNLIGIEATELVDSDAIRRYKAGHRWDTSPCGSKSSGLTVLPIAEA